MASTAVAMAAITPWSVFVVIGDGSLLTLKSLAFRARGIEAKLLLESAGRMLPAISIDVR